MLRPTVTELVRGSAHNFQYVEQSGKLRPSAPTPTPVSQQKGNSR